MAARNMAETKRHPWQDTIRQLEEERCEEMTNRRGPLPLRSSSAPRVPGHSARPPPIPVDYTNYNLPSSRRRPRVGIFRASSPHGGSATESNVDSLELALQDSSKTSSSTVSTTSRSPGRHSQDTSQETCSSGEDLLRVHDHQESYPPTRTPRNPASRPYPSAYSPNPTNPFANTPAFYYTTSHQNPIRHTQPEYYANTCQLPARNLSNDINDETKVREQFVSSYDPFSVAESTDGVENKTVTSSSASQMSGASSSEDPRYREKLGLHMLCAEATSQHDIAWRNALYLLGMQPPLAQVVDKLGRTALHVACEGNSEEDQNGSKNSPRHSTPPPSFMIRALLIANVGAVRQTDHHGRLPIHCLAASSGEVDSLQILVEAYPGSITVRDAAGFTPLALFLQNPMVHVSLAQTKILLGMTLPLPHEDDKRTRIRLRSGDHLNLKVEHLDQMMKETNPVYDPLKRYKIPEDILNSYPEDVRVCLKRLAQWDKRHNHQRQQDNNDKSPQDNSKDTSFGSSMAASVVGESETNPAAMASPTDRQLPLHMVVYRGLLDSNLQKSRTQQSSRSSPGRNGRKSKHSQHFHQQTLILLVRLLISAFPEGLITRDANGHTPLLLAMLTTNTEILPSQELLELLLGKRTAGFDSLPPWAQDVPYPSQHVYTPPGHDRLSAAAERYSNPAMVGTLDTCQLPLHVVAEEWGDQTSFIVAIYESYPGAIHVQDAKGRMPLHTLLQNYRRIAPNPQIVALLLSERVAQTSSDEGYLPFDLLVDCASHLPLEPSREPLTFEGYFSVPDPYAAFKQFFHASIIASSATARANLASKDGIMIASGPNYVQRRAEARKFLWRLRSLPPWLRRQACSVSFVQGLLVDELSSPTKCAFILMYGIFLALLLITFRRQLELYTETAQLSGFSPLVPTNSTLFDGSGEDILESSFLDKPMTRYEPWNTLAIYGLSAGLLCFQATFWACSWFLNEFQYLCLFNIWRWIDFLSVALSVLTTATIHEGFLEEQVLALGTAATGMLWLSVVGYLSNWWYGMAFFSGVILKIARMLAWPVVVSCVLLVGFAEMFYTLGQMNCSASSVESPSLCNLREAYQMIYNLFLGESINIGRNEPLSPGTAFLVGLFTALLGLLLLSFLVVAVVVASRCDGETVALDAYWEPKLAFVLSSQDTRAIGDDKIQKDKIQPPSILDSLVGRLEELWGISICLVSGRDSDRYWYARSSSQPKNCCLTLLTGILIPLWLAAGLFTLGFLWPPQVRRFIFEPRRGLFDGRQTNPGNETREYFVSQVSNVRNELTKLKAMSYEQGKDVHQELQELKALLIATMKED